MRAKPALFVLLLMAGCGSPPTNFYRLASVDAAAPSRVSADCPPVAVHHVTLPEILDRQAMVRALGPNRLEVSNQNRWAAPLDVMIQRVLATDLRSRLAPGRVLAPGDPAPAGGNAAGLDVNILRFMPETAGEVALQADWTLLDGGGRPVLRRSENLTVPAGPDPDQVVAGMSQALGDLASRMAGPLATCSVGRGAHGRSV